ncbi:hypothetical protein PV326_005936, partial [Microctonus aethiopoides]
MHVAGSDLEESGGIPNGSYIPPWTIPLRWKVRCAWIFIIAEDTIPGVLTRAREDWEEGEEEEIKKYYCYGGEVVMVVWYMYGSAPTRQAYRFKVFARDLFYSHAVYV